MLLKTMENVRHEPVMLNEVIEHLDIKPDGLYVDATLGLGGHAKKILTNIGPEGKLIGIDQDETALAVAKENLKEHIDQCTFVHDNFRNLEKVLKDLDINRVEGIVLDLGISSFQLDNPDRGFSIKADGPLDMRMNQNSHILAYDLVNSLSENEISTILKDFGEERFHQRIARAIVTERSKHPIESTEALSKIILKSFPRGLSRSKIHPATRTFQAFRIAVNRELEALDSTLDQCVDLLNTGGRVCIISFHSLEDRAVKQKFRMFAHAQRIHRINKKPFCPSEAETNANPRARSAKLRVAERI